MINKIKNIAIHLTVWVFLFFINFKLLTNFTTDYDFVFHLTVTAFYAIVFYATYYGLMRFFFKKKFLLFAILSIFLVTSTTALKQTFIKSYFDNKIEVISKTGDEKTLEFKSRANYPDHMGGKPMDMRDGPMDMHEKRPSRWPKMLNDIYVLILFFAIGFSLRFIKKWQDDEKNKSELEKEKVKTELAFLKQQVNPHFLFNSLNNIYSLSISKSENTTNAILKLSSILRYVLYEAENNLVNLQTELDVLNDYIELQKLKLTDKVDFKFNLIGENPAGYKIEPFIFIPIIENAFKYGVDNVNESFINIEISILNQQLSLHVSNKQVVKNENLTDSGIGINNLKRRLELLYPENHNFEILKENNIFTVALDIKLKK